ncbi:MAG: 2Fe-2S iron-sulfur cluster binding domain-containing protein [Alphaproteobacteria bacterium]|nr:2Fe-2S iron-sulfur cluster binding domain-containing protein [Alphaproteobacteria bacterium]
MTRIGFTLNGKAVSAEVEPRTSLVDFVREQLRLTGTHVACEQGVCGACTVTLDGEIARSCTTLAVACDGADVRTIEGYENDPLMARLRAAFTAEHGLQCGFCTPGMLITARDMIRRLGPVDEARIRVELSGNLCRCTGYAGIVRAIRRAMSELPANFKISAETTPAALSPAAFTPESAPVPSAVAAPKPQPARAGGGVRIEQSFALPHSPESVWAFFADLPRVAACLPGAELIDYAGGDAVKGRLTAKVGPISASFLGDAEISRDDARRAGTIRGGGRDGKSGSGATGEVEYRVHPDGAGTRVDVIIGFSLSGPLAQFGRSGLVRDFAGRMTSTFAANVKSALSGQALDKDQREFRAVPLVISVIWNWLKKRFDRF